MGMATDFFDPTSRNARARLAVSVELMRELSRYADPDELYQVFSKRLNQLYPTTRQLTVSRRGLDRPHFRVQRFNLWKDAVNPYRQPDKLPRYLGGLIGEMIFEDQPRVIDDLDLNSNDPARDYFDGQRSLLAIPIFDGGTATTMVIVTREDPAAFSRELIPELVWLYNLFARATQSLVLSQQLQEANDAAEYELRTIAELQQSLLPVEVPHVPGLDVAVHYRTANRAGGDYYDFFPLPDGRLGVLLADVSGHGTPAAVLMAITHSLTHARPDVPEHPGEFLAYLNDHLAKRYTLTTGTFVTAVYAVFDPHAGTVTYANAGHDPLRARLAPSAQFAPLDQIRRLPLGVTHRTHGPYAEQVVELRAGDAVTVYTDGITEALNPAGEAYGVDRLDDALATGDDAGRSVASLVSNMEHFLGSASAEDDRTLVLVRFTERARSPLNVGRAGAAR